MNRRLIGCIAATLLMISPSIGFAQSQTAAPSQWSKEHPRRAEVNRRLNNQNHRIRAERQAGAITGARARQLHAEDHQIRSEERAMASQDGSHVTKLEQRTLNQQENHVSRQIGE